MDIVKIVNGDYTGKTVLGNEIRYVVNLQKTKGYIGGYGISMSDTETMIQQIQTVKEIYGKAEGYRQIRHIIVSPNPAWNVSVDILYQMAFEIAMFYRNRYQICFGVHTDTGCLHVHFIMNTVSFIDGKLFSGGWQELDAFKAYVNQVMERYVPGLKRVITIEDL